MRYLQMCNMNPHFSDIFSLALSMGVKEDFFLRKLSSKKVLKIRHFSCTLEQQRSKMLMWLKKKTNGHVLWKPYSKSTNELGVPMCAVHDGCEVSNLFHEIHHGKNESKIFLAVRNFVKKGNNVDEVFVEGEQDMSLLQAACFFRRTKTVAWLLKAGANVNLCDSKFETALFYIMNNSSAQTEDRQKDSERQIQMLEMMSLQNANFQHQNQNGETILHLVATSTECNTQEKQRMIRIIKTHKNVELLKDTSHSNALETAVKKNLQGVVRILMDEYKHTYSVEYVMQILQNMTRGKNSQKQIEDTIKTVCSIDMSMMKSFCSFVMKTKNEARLHENVLDVC